MEEIFKKAFLDVREELVQGTLGIEGSFLQNAFTVLYFVFMILILFLAIKNAKEYYQLRRENKRLRRNIEKKIMTSFLAGKDKNKEEENIKDKK
jgi:preprotein translocase subunit SecG